MINVTKSFMPPRAVYDKYVSRIWKSGWLTNQGPLSLELEKKLADKFNVKHVFLINNGTVALQIALKSLGFIKGEIITTPFSYVATTSSIVWEGFTPVFVDIDPTNYTIDPTKIEKAITKNTVAILAVHVYGIPCDVVAIAKIAKKYNIRVIYDAAHAFGTEYHGKSIMAYGDISTISFHATKLFHTIEGGAIVTNNSELAHKISYMRNFGHKTPTSFYDVGINGKMSEFCAAMGLSIFGYIPKLISSRKYLSETYDSMFSSNSMITRPSIPSSGYNYPYYPILFDNEHTLLKVVEKLNQAEINPRRYFYPSLSTLPYVKRVKMPISESLSSRVLCLPLYPGLGVSNVKMISKIVLKAL